ncbi:hypothetical protein GKC56_00360 [Neisseriaceae bacterium PsAf]|nr:hypothetical protein [Neisseriaceae bacterium PsAf]
MPLVALVGCSDPKAANEKNFKKVIQAHLDEYGDQVICINAPVGQEQNVIAENDVKYPFAAALTSAGLLKEEKLSNNNDTEATIAQSNFTLTDEGQKFVKAQNANATDFCSGKFTVEKINNFTEPADALGETISKVDYRVKVKDLADWATNEEVQTLYPGLKPLTNPEGYDVKSILGLTNNGWEYKSPKLL